MTAISCSAPLWESLYKTESSKSLKVELSLALYGVCKKAAIFKF